MAVGDTVRRLPPYGAVRGRPHQASYPKRGRRNRLVSRGRHGAFQVSRWPVLLDGEICVLDQLGRSDFAAIHERVQRRRVYAGAPPVTYCVFDLLAVRGVDLSQRPLIRRKLALSKFLAAPPPSTLLVSYIKGRAEQVFHEAVIPLRLEGLVAKWAESVYQSGIRSNDWVKVKRKGVRPRRPDEVFNL
ncbi:hypothetical protein QTI51_37165 [Variovorax sp. J22G73]|uniref:ATP-dependent DNA ligase n=1 Tax=unclassified Variovorax TaxID=663243 RepID=UPI0025769306|nr:MULTISPECIES: hypothetical protein [unclassified Variovorax]MDM0010181.1 hypothetical protein [Variovorax sp. J22R203]MDM0102957.1 hypothetical protein [Variovorax sp. J22G73]